MDKAFDLGAEMLRITQDHGKMVQAGIEAGKRWAEGDKDAALRTILHAYDLSPDAQIPTPLMAAIEAARRVL